MKAITTIITLLVIQHGSAFTTHRHHHIKGTKLNVMSLKHQGQVPSKLAEPSSLPSDFNGNITDAVVADIDVPGESNQLTTAGDLVANMEVHGRLVMQSRSFAKAIFTKQDAPPIRFHASSSAIFTFGGGAWFLVTLMSLMSTMDTSMGVIGATNHLELGVIFASAWGLIISGLFYMPKSKRFEHYRRTFVATSAIMACDTMLWYWYANQSMMSQGMSTLLVPMACLAYALALIGEAQFILNDDNNRQEALETDLISPAIAAPFWKYVAITPTHLTTAFLKTVGIYHMLTGGTLWLTENPQAAAFGSILYMSNMQLAAWSAFTQGTMTIRRAPAFGKEIFRLENDIVTWGLFAAVFAPLVMAAVVGWNTGSLQEYFAF